MTPTQRQVLCSAAIVVMSAATLWTLRAGYADLLYRENTLEAVERAAAADPGNARYQFWLAEKLENAGRNPDAALAAAAALNPRDSAVWIRRGLRAEVAGRISDAEKFLLEAARVDRLYPPRWTLAGFYFRRYEQTRDDEPFWKWTRAALEIGYGDLAPVFTLCWRVTTDAGTIRTRALPPRHEVLGKYLRFLVEQARLEAAEPIARDFMRQATAADTGLLLAYCDKLLENKRGAAARTLWRALGQRQLVPYPEEALLINGDFGREITGKGFDWRLAPSPEVTAVRDAGFEIFFSGKQPADLEVLSQYVPADAGRYKFRFEYRTSGVRPGSGLRWRVGDVSGPALFSREWAIEEIAFRAAELSRLTLVYQRPGGQPPLDGSLTLRNLTLEYAE
ncbi:MAG: hypothetical protein ACRD96_16460 [Bryobacteraceae bacterium]